jgi:hypothetical protein
MEAVSMIRRAAQSLRAEAAREAVPVDASA